MEQNDYINYMIDQHLLKGNNYLELPQQEAMNIMTEFTDKLSDIVKFDHVNELTDEEIDFLQEIMKQ